MKIDKVGWYKRRDGKKARVVCVDGVDPWSVVAIDEQGIPTSYMPEGAAWSGNPGGKDLIALWTDEPVKGSLEWVKTLPPETMVWRKDYDAGDGASAKTLYLSVHPGPWHIVGTSEWANALPEGTKLTRGAWKPKDWIARNGGVWISQLASTHTVDGNGWLLYRKQALRPWKPEEVPVGVRVRTKGGKNWFSIVAAFETGALVVNDSGQNIVSWDNLMRHNEQIDGSPCGVMEDSK